MYTICHKIHNKEPLSTDQYWCTCFQELKNMCFIIGLQCENKLIFMKAAEYDHITYENYMYNKTCHYSITNQIF